MLIGEKNAAEEAAVAIEHFLPMPDTGANFASIVYAAPILLRLGEMSENDAQSLHRGSGGSTHTRKARATREAPKRGQVRDDRTNRTPVRDRLGALGWRRGS